MKPLRTLLLIGCLVGWGAYLMPEAKAGEWEQKSVLTFSQPVEIPGIVLPAGTYVFSFLGSTADRSLIDVLSQDEQKVYATIEAMPHYRANASGGTSVVFEERKAGAPHAIKEWFFPDPRYGHEFVYPGMGALERGESYEPMCASGLVESPGLQSTEAQSAKNEPDDTMAHSGQITQPEESDYLRLLYQKQNEEFGIMKADERANTAIESDRLSYLPELY
jgi:hypothetical protein